MFRYWSSKKAVWYLIFAVCLICAGCTYNFSPARRYGSDRLSFEIFLDEGDIDSVSDDFTYAKRDWISFGDWNTGQESSYIYVSLTDDSSRRYYSSQTIPVDKYVFGQYGFQSGESGELVELTIESRIGRITFEGGYDRGNYDRDVTAFGTVEIQVDSEQVNAIKTAFGENPSLKVLIQLILKDVSVEQLIGYSDCGVTFNIEQITELVVNDFKVDALREILENGYDFDADDFVRLARYHISSDYAIEWKRAEYDLSAEDLVFAKQRSLSVESALQWKQVGMSLSLEQLFWIKQRNLRPDSYLSWKNADYDLSLEQLFWVKQRNLSPGVASEWVNTGFRLSLEQLFWVKQRNLRPDNYQSWKDAGYDLSLDQLFWAKQRNLRPHEAGQWRQYGYDFSIEDLYELKRYNVSLSYGAVFADPDYEQLSAEQLIEFKRSNISTETIQQLRTPKSP